MEVFTITTDNADNLNSFFSETAFINIGKEGYYTLGAYDDDGFVAGVLQFYVDFSQSSECYGLLSYMYIHDDFVDSNAAQVLIDEYESILSASGIKDRIVMLPAASGKADPDFYTSLGFKIKKNDCLVYTAKVESLVKYEVLEKASAKNIKTISGLDDKDFLKLQKDCGCNFPVRNKSYYDTELSSYFIEDSGCGLFLIKHGDDGRILTSFLGCSKSVSEKYLLRLISFSAKKAQELYGSDALVSITCRKAHTKKMISQLFPDIVPERYIEATMAGHGDGIDDPF